MKSRIVAAALFLLIAMSPVAAQTPHKADASKAAKAVREHQRVTGLQEAAATALKSQTSQEGHDCPDAKNQHEFNICLDKVVLATRKDFDTFYQNLKALRKSDPTLEAAQGQWKQYMAKSCDAIDELYRGGTIRPAADAECEITLTRSRMKDLDALYSTVLHN